MRRADSETSDAEDLDDDRYEWDGEDDLVDEAARFEEKRGGNQKKKTWGFKRVMALLFSSLVGSTFLAGLIATPAILVTFFWEKPHPSEYRSYVSDNISAWLFWVALDVLVSWYLAVLVDLVPIVVLGSVGVFWGEVTEKLKVHVETFGVLKGWIKPVLYAAWGWGSWVVMFGSIYHLYSSDEDVPSRAGYTPRVRQVIELLFFIVLVYSLEKIALQFVALSFHRVAFKDRLTEIEFAISVLDRLNLYKPSPSRSGASTPTNLDRFIVSPLTTPGSSRPPTPVLDRISHSLGFHHSHKLNAQHRNSSSSSYLQDSEILPTVRPKEDDEKESQTEFADLARGVKNVVLHDARNIKGKDGRISGKSLAFDVANASAAKHLAKSIYIAYKGRAKRPYLLESDFSCAFETDEDTKKAFKVFDKDGNGDISRSEIKTLVLKVYKERRLLARSMQDVDQAVGSLNSILLAFGVVIIFFIALTVFGVEFGTQFASLYTILIGLSFIFKSAASNAFDAIIFIFVTHPFDTGDRVFIGTENLVVKKLRIFSTLFQRVDGTEAFYANSLLSAMKIINVRRSGDMAEGLSFSVGWGTPTSKLDELEKCVSNWLATSEQRDLGASSAIMVQKIEFQTRIECTFGIPHLSTWQDWQGRWARRTRFHAAVKYYMEQLNITCTNSSQPIHFVASSLDNLASPSLPFSPSDAQSLSTAQPTTPCAPVRRQPTIHHPLASSIGRSAEGGDLDASSQAPTRQTLGFLPPPEERGAKLMMRRRKTKSRNKIMGMAGGD
ncbi:Mechanosensitive ion channel-domain-containing protein [Mrakia frigida]|uniref:Mechanosensitive ion channel-domain-containing protein n=1 Tax=Mrakia frigida TaxID=29902 RepID=UPI003FCC11B6